MKSVLKDVHSGMNDEGLNAVLQVQWSTQRTHEQNGFVFDCTSNTCGPGGWFGFLKAFVS